MGVLDTLNAATPNRRDVTVIVDAALAAEHAALGRDLDSAADADERDGTLADPHPNMRRAVEALEAIRDRVAASEVTFTVEAMAWHERIALQSAHPPRDKNLVDARFGYNAETFPGALVRASTISVTGADNRLTSAAFDTNDSQSAIPPSARFLLETQDSEASSTPPSPGESPRDDFAGGSPRGSRKSSTTKKATSTRAKSRAT